MIPRDAHPICPRMKMLKSVVEFMSKSGVSESAIREFFEKSLADLSKRPRDSSARRREAFPFDNEDLGAELLRFWYRDSRYIDQDARPRPLALRKGRSSIAALIKRIDPSADAHVVFREMIALGMIRKTSAGKYLPTSESAVARHQLAVDRVAKLVVRLISTASKNVDPTGRHQPLIERSTWVLDLNPADRQAFAEFTQSQGRAYIQMMDDWLEQRRLFRTAPSGRKRNNGVTAGVHVFAYLDDGDGGFVAGRPSRAHIVPKRNAKRRLAALRGKAVIPPREARA